MCRSARSLLVACSVFSLLVVSVDHASADYPATVLSDNPIGYWRLGEAGPGPTALDETGTVGLDYTLFDAPAYGQAGAIFDDPNTAVHFTPAEGVNVGAPGPSGNPSIISPNDSFGTFFAGESFSLEYWIKAAPGNLSDGGAGILTKGYSNVANVRPWYLSRLNGGTVDFFLRDLDNTSSVATASTPIADDQWHHVVGVYDAGAAKASIYVDGLLEGSVANVPAANFGGNDQPFTIGNHLNRKLDASLDEVAVYAAALSGEQVLAHALAGGIELSVPDDLRIDFGSSVNSGGGPGGLQAGFTAIEAAEGGGNPDVTRNVLSALGDGGIVDVTIGGYTHFRDYAGLTGSAATVSELLSDMVLRNADGTMSVTLENLKPGNYDITTFHHSSQFGGGALDINLTDANGVSAIASALAITAGTEPAPASSMTFSFVSDGSPVQIDFLGGTSGQHSSLNGFSVTAGSALSAIDVVLAVEINDRGAPEELFPEVTTPGFREFLIGGDENNDFTEPTTRQYDDISVTISHSNGAGIGDRRRGQPANGGLFTDSELLRDFIFARNNTAEDGLDILVEGLDPGTAYEVKIWSFDDGSPTPRTSVWSANGGASVEHVFDGNSVPPSPAFNEDNTFSFLGTTDANGSLLITGRVVGGNPAVFLNAFQISAVVPEPGTITMLILGLLTLVPLTRRFRKLN